MAASAAAGGKYLSFDFGRKRVGFSLAFAYRKHLKISVHPDGRVTVAAPWGKSDDDVLARVRRRAPWIIKQQDYFARLRPQQPPRRYVSGETHLYLGRQYRLKIIRSDTESVKLVGRYFQVSVRSPKNSARVKQLLDRWYASLGMAAILRRLQVCCERMRSAGLPSPRIHFRKMTSRWGSCSRRGTITINLELAKAPIPCIDYLLIHELCHLKYPHHGPEFQRLLSRFLPEWRHWKERLEAVHLPE